MELLRDGSVIVTAVSENIVYISCCTSLTSGIFKAGHVNGNSSEAVGGKLFWYDMNTTEFMMPIASESFFACSPVRSFIANIFSRAEDKWRQSRPAAFQPCGDLFLVH